MVFRVLLAATFAVAAFAILQAGALAKPRDVRDCADCPEMVRLPGGTFLMGSPATEAGRLDDEGPQKRVTVRPFAVGRYPVTRGQWAAFAAATGRPTEGGCAWAGPLGHRPAPEASWRKVSFPQTDDHPVICVTWKDANDYAAWLSQRTGHRYRLLSEAEWEYAARAGTRTAFFWGDVADHGWANYGAKDCCSGLAEGRDQWAETSPVGAFPPNAFGLHDMSGNVMQWVQDCMHDYADTPADGAAYDKPRPLTAGNLAGTDACAYRMLRGGDWGNPPEMIRSAARNYAPAPGSTLATYRSAGLGFRVARELQSK